MELTFLGTSCMVPTKERNQPSQLLSFKGENILVDCGEGTQRQLKLAGLKAPRITRILITHWHGDHVLGIPGLLQTISSSDYEGTLHIYGPKGTKEKINAIVSLFDFDQQMDMKVHEVSSGLVEETPSFRIEALPMRHRITCLGYRFIEKDRRRIKVGVVRKLGIPDGPLLGKLQRGKDVEWKGKKVSSDDVTSIVKGKKVAFIFDTLPNDNAVHLAEEVDVLVSEAVYSSELESKAAEHKHLTAEQAAGIAAEAGAKRLVLTHMSQRYRNCDSILKDAKKLFPKVVCAKDLMKIKV